MNQDNFEKIKRGNGFIAAMDQSANSTPKILSAYGVPEESYKNKEKMFDLIHEMRSRIITSPEFNSQYILGTILFEQTMDSKIDGMYTANYLTKKKNIVPFLKIDKGLENKNNGVQLMKPIDDLNSKLKRAKEHYIFGTKERSVIKEADKKGIKDVVEQQFDIAQRVIESGLVPIVEPEVDINSPDKEECEELLKPEIKKYLDSLKQNDFVMLKLTIPTVANLYKELIEHPNVIRVVALSGGYERKDANKKLEKNVGLIASFARALIQDLDINQTDDEFNTELQKAIESIYRASIS